jgi:hypothetical protein
MIIVSGSIGSSLAVQLSVSRVTSLDRTGDFFTASKGKPPVSAAFPPAQVQMHGR